MIEYLLVIIGYFFLALILRTWFKKLCAICMAISLSWLTGIFLGWSTIFLAILMGGSLVGSMYYLAHKLPENLGVFKLPYLLTGIWVINIFLQGELDLVSICIIGGLWIIMAILYVIKDGPTREWFKKIVECCKNW